MFSRIASRYDLANRVLSSGFDLRWRRHLVRWANPQPGERVLDVGTGTGDLLIELIKQQPSLQLAGVDLSREMLGLARGKFQRMRIPGISLLEGDALNLPFRAQSFDAVTIAFGLRNLPDLQRGLREMANQLRHPGGRLLALEFSLPTGRCLQHLYPVYLRYVLPEVGGVITGSREAYQYLQRSIHSFPAPAEILEEFEEMGFSRVEAQPLSGGIVVAYRAIR